MLTFLLIFCGASYLEGMRNCPMTMPRRNREVSGDGFREPPTSMFLGTQAFQQDSGMACMAHVDMCSIP